MPANARVQPAEARGLSYGGEEVSIAIHLSHDFRLFLGAFIMGASVALGVVWAFLRSATEEEK